MKRYWEVLKIFVRNETLAKFEYRGALWSDLVFFIMGYGTQMFLIYLMVDRFDNLGGWTKYEVMLLYAMSILQYTIACTFLMGPSAGMVMKIRSGYFDQTLTKPMQPLGYEIISSFSAYYTVHVLLGIVMVAICFIGLGIQLTVINFLMLVLFTIGGAMIQGGTLILFSSATFYLIGDNPLVFSVFITLRMLGENPISIFPRFVQIFTTVIMPFAFLSFYPAQYFLDKNDFLMFHPVLQFLSPLVGVILLSIACLVWSRGISRYQSSGS